MLFDASGLAQAIGSPEDIARAVQQLAGAHGLTVRIAVASTTSAAWMLAHAQDGITIVPPGEEARALGAVPLSWLKTIAGSQAPGQRPQ